MAETNLFEKFNKDLEKKLGKDTKDISSIAFKKLGDIKEYIFPGNYLLAAQLSGSLFGGAPNSRSMEIAGAPGTGKSFICLNMARESNKMGYFVYYVDTEGAMEENDLLKFGCKSGMYQYIRTIKTYSQVKRFVNDLMTQKKKPEFADMKVVVFLDSFGLLLTDKELEDLAKGKNASDMGLRAKEGRQLFKILTLEMSNMGIPFIFTNHTGAKIDLFGGTKIGGGDGPTYSASVILKLAKGNLKGDDKKTKTGIVVYSETEKNRLARPLGIQIHISFQKGMNRYVGLQDYTNWETCGVQKGKLYTKAEYDKAVSGNSKAAKDLSSRRAEHFTHQGSEYTAVLYDGAENYVVRSEAKMVDRKKFFSSEVFSESVLKELDENIIKPTFKYKDISSLIEDEYEDLANMSENEDSSNDESEDDIELLND